MGQTLSEHDSKELLSAFGIPVLEERLAASPEEAVRAATEIGFPVVVKLCGDGIAHKTERNLVRLGVASADDAKQAGDELLAAAEPPDGEVSLLVAPMARGRRELIAGVQRDPQFGPCVMIGIGGVLAESIGDVAFALAPIDDADADEMLDALEGQAVLGPWRGEPALDRDAVVAVLRGLSDLVAARPDVHAVDVNPLVIVDGRPVAVDALVELADGSS